MNKHLIAVYGSLKKGFGNHRLLKSSEFLGTGETFPVFKMISLTNYPGLLDGEDSIEVEVYEVDDATFRALDLLEGYPSFYNRVLTIVTLENEQTVPAWIYKLNTDNNYYHSSYERPRYSNVLKINPSLISWSM
ncbi:gamma-glutamyl cyclotransferase [Caudoviricetes sp.]|nr:gamma-glutamyl cyclotransferase [Caudoviricetes sp.]